MRSTAVNPSLKNVAPAKPPPAADAAVAFAKYIDIDSTYRDRHKYPYPAQFTLEIEQSGMTSYGLSAVNPVSNEIVLFPPQPQFGATQYQWQPVAYYNNATTLSVRQYLPFAYMPNSNNPSLLRIDELPIAPTIPPSTSISSLSIDTPRYVLSPGQANNYYVGKYIQIRNEFREIIGYQYDTTNTILQTVTIVSITYSNYILAGDLESQILIELDAATTNQQIPSHVDRNYQGKYIQFTNGESRLISNSYVNDAGNVVLTVNSLPITIPTVGSSAQITTAFNYYVQLETPFDTAIGRYPASGSADVTIMYAKNTILDTPGQIMAIASTRASDADPISIAYQTVDSLYFAQSIASGQDQDGYVLWGEPVLVVQVAASFANTDNFLSAEITSLDIKFINGTPAILYSVQSYVTGTGFRYDLMYVHALDAAGAAWASPVAVTPAADNVYSTSTSLIKLVVQPENSGVPYFEGYPAVIWLNGAGTEIHIALGSVDYDSPTWTDTLYRGVATAGFVVGAGVILDAPDATIATALYRIHVFYKDFTTGYPSFNANPIMSAAMSMYGGMATMNVTITTNPPVPDPVPMPIFTFQIASTGNIYFSRPALYEDAGYVSYAESGAFLTQQVGTTSGSPAMQLICPNNYPDPDPAGMGLTNIIYFTGHDLYRVSINALDLSIGDTARLESITGLTVLTLVPHSTIGDACIIYNGGNNQVSILVPSASSGGNGDLYRIRSDLPKAFGAFVLGGSTTTIQLSAGVAGVLEPLNHNYVGDYLWIINRIVDYSAVPANFVMVNDYRQIIAYDTATNTATVTPAFSTDIGQAVTNGLTFSWEILSYSTDSSVGLNVTAPGSGQQQMVCYDVALSNLILPNVTLSTGLGNLIAFYPYVLVKLINLSARERNILYSNNPHTSEILFKVPITNTVTPTSSTFVPLLGAMMRQTIKFKPRDAFEFAVYLPNGELFQTLQTDTLPPFPPNPNIQISAVFEIRRVNTPSA